MNNLIANLFARVVAVTGGMALVGSTFVGVISLFAMNGSAQAWAILFLGPLASIVAFGALALSVQNNLLLRQIASNTGRSASPDTDVTAAVPKGRTDPPPMR